MENILNDFLASLMTISQATPQAPEEFLGKVYTCPDSSSTAPLLRILAGGSISAHFPYSYDISSLDCYMLLYTEEGCGKLLLKNEILTLSKNSLLFFHGNSRFRIDIAIEPWSYKVLFLSGKALRYYYELLTRIKEPFFTMTPHPETQLYFEQLLSGSTAYTLSKQLNTSALLHTFFAHIVSDQLQEQQNSQHIPSYIEEMKNMFDNHYAEYFTLDELEKHFEISKYRLCREFSFFYGDSPLQYLNRHRIHVAGQLLLTTNYKVHEIGSMVGIDNTNHFITLFKKYTSLTPLQYKQRITN